MVCLGETITSLGPLMPEDGHGDCLAMRRDVGGNEDRGKPSMQGIVMVFLFLPVFQHTYC